MQHGTQRERRACLFVGRGCVCFKRDKYKSHRPFSFLSPWLVTPTLSTEISATPIVLQQFLNSLIPSPSPSFSIYLLCIFFSLKHIFAHPFHLPHTLLCFHHRFQYLNKVSLLHFLCLFFLLICCFHLNNEMCSLQILTYS